jgi:hypothetical protein
MRLDQTNAIDVRIRHTQPRSPATQASIVANRMLQTLLETGSDKTSKHFYEMLKLKNTLKYYNLSN